MANTIRGADLLVKSLAEAGVNTIFALSGNQIMSIFDACLDFDINIVHTRHEGAAVYMAEAYAQLTGSPGVALVTAGAGVGNAAGALFSASESDTPLLLMSGDSPVALDGKGAFQELHQTAITSALTRWSHRVESVNTLGRDFYQALQLACTPHPGPVHLALPADVLNHQAPVDSQPLSIVRDAAATESIEKTAQALAAALQPVVVTGPSINRTRQLEFCQALEQKYNVP
ncbi:MAG: thiamine pyrophosphate-binding protein, partial [Pseudomonadota bacterium]